MSVLCALLCVLRISARRCEAVLLGDGRNAPRSRQIDPDHQDRRGAERGAEKTQERHVHAREPEVRSSSPPVPHGVEDVQNGFPGCEALHVPWMRGVYLRCGIVCWVKGGELLMGWFTDLLRGHVR